jgi:hypothetical protein
MRTTLLAIMCGAALACSGDDAEPTDEFAGLYQIDGDAIVCDGAVEQVGEPELGPFTEYRCEWENAVQGCAWAEVIFLRPTASAEWQVFATWCCNPLSDSTWRCG